MKSLRHVIAAVLVGGILIAASFGCGQAPTAPPSASVSGSGSGLSASPGAAGQSSGLISTVGSTLGGVVGGVVNLVVRTLDIVGSIGGSLTNGLWRVDVPAGAIDGNATIGISVAGPRSSECDLSITPADKNHFSTPVTLTFDCSGVPADQLANYVVFWFNPSTNQWEPVAGSTVDLGRKTVSAPLHHFSRYEAAPADGKAGW
jgi:hypothetical protein